MIEFVGKGGSVSVKIVSVADGTYGERAGIISGDELLSINGNEIYDVLDYRFYMTDKKLEIELLYGSTLIDIENKHQIIIDDGHTADLGRSQPTDHDVIQQINKIRYRILNHNGKR